MIYCLEITNKQYNDLKKLIEKFEKRKRRYKYNFIGLCAVAFNRRIEQENAFYCAEFVKYVLERTHIVKTLPEVIKPEDFQHIETSVPIYEGSLRTYALPHQSYSF